MNFKEQLEKDLENVFFNLDEFAEIINLNGISVKGILQSVKYEPFSINKNDSSILGISGSYYKLYYKTDATAEVLKAQGSDFCDASISRPSRKEVEMRSWTEPPHSVSAGAFTATKRDLKNLGTNFLNNLDFFVSQQIMVNGEYYTIEYIEKEQGMNILTLSSASAR